jgi:hypothetical protein
MKTHPNARVVALCIRRPGLRAKLIGDPKRVLTRLGIAVPEDRKILVLEDTLDKVHVVVPKVPHSRGTEAGVIAKVLDEVRSNADYRKRFMADPKQAFETLTGTHLPDRPQVVAVMENARNFYIHLPPAELGETNSPAEAAAMWGGGGGGDDPWWTDDRGTDWGSGQICNCQSDTYELDSMITTCCDTEWPDDEPIVLDGNLPG